LTDLRFDDRVAVVTGAGNGLGRAHALLLAERGARVVVNDLGGSVAGDGADAGAAAAVVDEIRQRGGVAVASTDSVSSAAGGAAIVQTALDEFGRLDILINNAGILRDVTLHRMTAEQFESVIAVHLLGAFYVTQPAFVHMRERGYGRIVLTTSAAGLYGNFGQVNYSAAKMGLVGMAKSISLEGAKYDIRANVVAPVAASRMTKGLMPPGIDQTHVPEAVSPLFGYLSHESCSVAGEVFSSYAGHVGRVFVGETPGVTKPGLSIEDVADTIDEIRSLDGFVIPATAVEALFVGQG
jgi:NAD(P)-dependent dehydrogenase (short-subunit alcohol dehydrogenase family)